MKTKNNSKIRQTDEIETLTLNNQFECLEQHVDFTIERDEAVNRNTKTSTEKAGNKINIYQNKNKIPSRENRRPNNCVTGTYLQNVKNRKYRKKKKDSDR